MKTQDLLKKAALYIWRELIRPALLVGAVVFPLKSAIADWNWVPTGSMKPTILEGDLVFVNKLAYDLKIPFTLTRLAHWDEPQHGDIVVFFSPQDGKRFVKRVIGLPGDTLEMKDNVLWRNGQVMEYELRPNIFAKETYEDPKAIVARERSGDQSHWVMALPSRPSLRTFGPVTVPAGKYFLMGDSRDNSFDSRFFGLVERKAIVGKANRVILSFDKNHFYIPRVTRFFSPLS
jgi:signal peptidase I